jgi:hypothetical protein
MTEREAPTMSPIDDAGFETIREAYLRMAKETGWRAEYRCPPPGEPYDVVVVGHSWFADLIEARRLAFVGRTVGWKP